MRLGFYAWNLFQIQHVAALLRRLDEASLFFHARSGTDVDAILKHPTVADVADRAEVLRDRDIPSLDRRLDALVFQTLFPGIETLEQPCLIGLQYSMAKERHQYGAWRAIADLNLVYGPWSAERVAPFSPVVQVGNPRWSDHFDAPIPSLLDLNPNFDSSKRTLLYLPTWEELSSLDEFAEAIAALREDYNLLFAPHHNSRRFESERTAAAMRAICGNTATVTSFDVGHLIRASDVVLSDFSGAIFDAILFEKPVLLLQSDALNKIGRKFGPESIEFQRREEIGPVVERPEDLPRRLDDLLSGRLDYAAAHQCLRQECFAATRDSADLAIAAMRQSLEAPPARSIHQIYIAELCRESQVRQAKLRALQRRIRRGRILRQRRLISQLRQCLEVFIKATAPLRDASAVPVVADASLRIRLATRFLPSSRLLTLAQRHESRDRRDLSKIYTLAALAKGTGRSLAWTTQMFVHEEDEKWRLAVLDLLLAKPPGALDSILLRANRLQNVSGLRRIEFAKRRQEIRERLRNRTQARLRDLRVAFGNRWLEDAQALADRIPHNNEQVQSYRQALADSRERLKEFAPLTEIANRNEMENLESGHFECLYDSQVKRLDELPPGTRVVELPLPPYFYSPTVTEPQAHERICRFLRQVYTEVFASGHAVLPRHQYMLTHADPSGIADVTLSYHTAGAGAGRWHLKDSALPGYFSLDPHGYAGWSSIAGMSQLPPEVEAVSSQALEDNLQSLRRETVEVNRSKYAQPARGNGEVLPKSFIFLPLQVLDDAVQQLAHIPLLELLAALLEHARTEHAPLVLKRHPACKDSRVETLLKRAARTPGVTLTTASIHDILPRARAVVTINSGVGLEALIHERPVILAGRAEYAYACAQVSSVEELRATLNGLDFDQAWRERIRRFLYFYRNHYLIHGEDKACLRRRLAAILPPQRRVPQCPSIWPQSDEASLDKLTVNNVIVSGFSYSGSSAVVDLLRDHAGVAKFPGKEFRFLRASWGANNVANSLKSKRASDYLQAVEQFHSFCQGEMPELRKTDGRCNAFVRSVHKELGVDYEVAVVAVIEQLRRAGELPAGARRLAALNALRSFFTTITARVATQKKASHVILDQALRPWTLHHGACFNACAIVIVRRDARDQFVDQYNKAGFPVRDVRAFMKELNTRYARIERKVAELRQMGHHVLQVQFEDLVREPNRETARLTDFLGLEYKKVTNAARRFQPETSRKNLWLFEAHADREAIDFITEHYPHLLALPAHKQIA